MRLTAAGDEKLSPAAARSAKAPKRKVRVARITLGIGRVGELGAGDRP